MRRIVVTLVLTLMISVQALAQSANSETDARAQEVLKQARAALGNEAKLQAIQSFSAVGKFRRAVSGSDLSGELEFNLLLPDKYKKLETINPAPSVSITSIDIVNGQKVVLDKRTSGPGNIIFNRYGSGEAAYAAAQRAVRQEYARLLISWLLTAPSSFPAKFKYLGEAEAPDGRADMLEVTGPESFTVQLFLDKKTHLPLMLAYQAKASRSVVHTADGRESSDAVQKKILDKIDKTKADGTEVQLRFSEYRAVNGVLFPHQITKATDGKVTEEWQMSYKINPSFSADRFDK